MAPLHPEIRKYWEELNYRIVDDQYLGLGSYVYAINLKTHNLHFIAYVGLEEDILYLSFEDFPPPGNINNNPKLYSEKTFLEFIKNKPIKLKAFW